MQVRVGIGSNIDRDRNILRAIKELQGTFAGVRLSPVYEAKAVGFDGDPFLNLVAEFESEWSPGRLQTYLKELEAISGRTGKESKWSGRTLDIDILTMGDLSGLVEGVELPREEILEVAYVLRPLAELAPHDRHPVTGMTYGEHWKAFAGDRSLFLYALRSGESA